VGKGKRVIGHFPFIISHFPFCQSIRPQVQANRNDFLKNDQMKNVKWKMTNDLALPLEKRYLVT